MSRLLPTSEEIFYKRIQTLIKNLITENINDSNNYFFDQTKLEYRDDVRERGQYILEEIEKMKHLIIEDIE